MSYWIPAFAGMTKKSSASLDSQPLHDLPVLQVLLDNLVDILPINIAVPDRLRVHRHHRPFGTAIQASRGVDPHPTFAGQPQLLASLFGIITKTQRVESLTALTTVFTQVGTEKDMIFVIRHLPGIPSGML